MKVLTSGEQLEGKKIVYCDIEHTTDIDTSMIITDDKSVLMFGLNYDKYTWYVCNENQVIGKILRDDTIGKTLAEYGVITEEYIRQMRDKLDCMKRKVEQEMKKRELKEEYEKYLQLKEKFEVSNIPNN
ncbi:hypothetical protein [Clostridium botulinum]|uniref:hypothetical protein n=1 Tax=Clostridium botulinum TaxID=1491 RepID=UPI0004D49B9D|nr:hypothetical protein [Clostridium botulinum]KEH99752.1 hypothetical protein Z952_p0077 [Clostridium botulinum C/D str. BKT75002]KEI05230.1 hypothetical protein Z954_0077 [Clostridium botulinum C/D str. BKT2873]QPW62120.1 hypothetical protein IG390_13775 [Clostridium botulinum]